MIYLDTHAVLWLYAGQVEKFSQHAISLLNENEIYISVIVQLELQYLNEIQRITGKPNEIVSDLSDKIGLKICEKSFNVIINHAMNLSWTRDPFDRIIVANAALNDDVLITKDQSILDHYPNARW